MFYVCYEEESAKDNLFDIATELQDNDLLLADFGQLYFDEGSEKKKSKKSSIGNFLTSNGIRVQASSVKKTVRGKMYKASRPDYYVIDDFENNKTKGSIPMTKQTIDYFDELIPGISVDAKVIFLCNKVSDTGSVAWLYDKMEDNERAEIIEVPVVTGYTGDNWKEGEITWPAKYAMTDIEAMEKNALVTDPKKKVFSLEQQHRLMNKDGRKVFEQEMLNKPLSDSDRFFDHEVIDNLLEIAEGFDFEKDGNWKIWDYYQFEHEYVIGADVSEGMGLDSSVIHVIDLTEGCQVAEYESNVATPNELVDELLAASENYGDAKICPENNSVGTAVIGVFRERNKLHLLSSERKLDTKTKTSTTRYGFKTTINSKPDILFKLKRAVEDGDLIIKSKPLLRELRGFTALNVRDIGFDPEATRHYDRVMAMAITNNMRFLKDVVTSTGGKKQTVK